MPGPAVGAVRKKPELPVLKRALFAAVACALVFGVLELILWAVGVSTLIEREDPFRGFSGLLSVFQQDGEVYRTRRPIVGSVFNDQSFLVDKPANGVRMFCLGASSSYGYPWGADTAFPAIIGEAVAASHPDLRIEAVNASGVSYAMHRMNIVADELLSFKPDIFIVFEGHNEFIEPAYFEKLKHRSASRNRLEYVLAHTRLYSGMRSAWDHLKHHGPTGLQEIDAVVERDQTRTFSRDDKAAIIAEFRWRLERLVRRGQAAGAKVLLSTVPCNLLWRPEGSMIEGLGEEARRDWAAAFGKGKQRLDSGDFAGACTDLEDAARIAPAHAETQFLLGQAYQGLGRWDDARLAYRRACDADTRPIRRLSGINAVIRAVARESGALLVDIDRVFEQHSEHGLVEFNLLEDYVHPTREGHELIARAMWEAMEDAGWFKGNTRANGVTFDKLIAERHQRPVRENATWIRNQAVVLQNQGRIQAAMEKYGECLARTPTDQTALLNLGGLLYETGRSAEAVDMLERLIALNRRNFVAFNNLGNALLALGRTEDAILRYRQAVRIQPDYAQGHANLGFALAQAGNPFEAMREYEQALRIEPDSALAHRYLGQALLQAGKLPEAVAQLEEALRIDPQCVPVANRLGSILIQQGRLDEAIAVFEKVLNVRPLDVDAHYRLGIALRKQGKLAEALAHWREGLRLRPNDVFLLNDTAYLLATSPDASTRNGKEAVGLAGKCVELSGGKVPAFLDTLAAAYAEAGRYSEALKTAEEALALASSQEKTALTDELRARIKLYRSGVAFHEASGPSERPPPGRKP